LKAFRNSCFDAFKVLLENYYDKGIKNTSTALQVKSWLSSVTTDKRISDLLDDYLEIEQVRFLKQYGHLVEPSLIEPCLNLIKAIHGFRTPPLLTVLSHFKPLTARQDKIFEEI
jgi:hypothetical protein